MGSTRMAAGAATRLLPCGYVTEIMSQFTATHPQVFKW